MIPDALTPSIKVEKAKPGRPRVKDGTLYDSGAELLMKVYDGFMSQSNMTVSGACQLTNAWATMSLIETERSS